MKIHLESFCPTFKVYLIYKNGSYLLYLYISVLQAKDLIHKILISSHFVIFDL